MTALLNPATAPDEAAHGETSRKTSEPVSVGWSHAVPIAVVTAFASGFWLISMRGAVGAIERTSAPFESWWRESALTVPAHLAAVLVAFALAVRWFGRGPLGFRRTLAVIALAAAATTIVGALIMAGSSVLDYRLQAAALEHMSVVHAGCDATCTAARVDATQDLLIKSVGIGAALMMVTNLVLVGLLVAFRGGRVVLAAPRAPREPRVLPLVLVLAASLVGASAIHAAVMPAHLEEWWAAGAFFLVLTMAELAAANAVLVPRGGVRVPALLAAIAVSVVPLAVWSVSRTVGLPFGPEVGGAEPIGIADVMACALELLGLSIALRLVLGRAATRRPWTPYRLAIGLAVVVAATTIGVGASGIPGFDSVTGGEHGHDASEAAT